MGKRTSLVEFQRELLERLSVAPRGEALNALLAVALGDEPWLIGLGDISEVLPVPPIETVPWTKRWLQGAVNVRGQVYGVVDLAAFVGAGAAAAGPGARILLVHRRIANACALLVPRVIGLRNPTSFIADLAMPGDAPWVRTIHVDAEKQRWSELDLRRLTSHPTFLEAAL
ncbi:MAG: chemotaxis protein CheW [Gammaproteobacteria bacterium]|nr:chemotaxis protein CheW [Gammaproteobacteria bacterium]MBI5617079.1 chemotaxis protein CheW [Gammaproteobacteria bacterium]